MQETALKSSAWLTFQRQTGLVFDKYSNVQYLRIYFPAFMILAALLVTLPGCVASKDPQSITARKLQRGLIKDDTSFVYALPYPAGKKYLMVQGYFTRFSHRNRAAIDFKMSEGTLITAARSGVVIRAASNNNKGGWNRKYRANANYIVIEHEDGSRAGYWHLQQNGVMVQVGDTVRQGQPIGRSGSTGYSAFPHLHFFVWSNKGDQWSQLPTRFFTRNGPKYLRPMRKYTSVELEPEAVAGKR